MRKYLYRYYKWRKNRVPRNSDKFSEYALKAYKNSRMGRMKWGLDLTGLENPDAVKKGHAENKVKSYHEPSPAMVVGKHQAGWTEDEYGKPKPVWEETTPDLLEDPNFMPVEGTGKHSSHSRYIAKQKRQAKYDAMKEQWKKENPDAKGPVALPLKLKDSE